MARKGKNTPAAPVAAIVDQPLTDILSQRYLSYALSTITSRSLPDVRDGLKPVHRRLLYAMSQLGLSTKSGPKKSARVVGDVIGKFHPHGDTAVYDAMVRLAQDFAVRYPLVDGQGNFGNIDGDNAAAMRYTEARLTAVAELMLEGLDENAVDFRPTYDNDSMEPIVMPANFPHLLANGSSGIAVGMATNIPPHNIAELLEACELVLTEDAPVEKLTKVVKGPDFPTGGELIEPRENIVEAYKTGKGSFRLRAKWEREELKRGTYQIVVTEIPYQVQKSKLVEKIAELIQTKKVPLLDDVRDESAEDIRLILVPKSQNVEPELLMEMLFRNTDLEIRFSLNMNVLDGGLVPKVMNLKEVLRAWLDHRQQVLVRRSQYRLEKVLHRIEVLDGFMIVYLNIDKVIKCIREADEPKADLMKKFKLSEVQADAVLNMRLRALHKLEEIEIKKEHDALSKERDALQALLKSEKKQWAEIGKQIAALKETFGPKTALGARRTKISKAPSPVDVEELQEILTPKEPVTVDVSSKGWVRAFKGHDLKASDMKYKDGDRSKYLIEAQTTDKLWVFGTNGRFYTVGCDKLPAGRGFGEPLRLMVDLPNEADVAAVEVYNPEGWLLVASDEGHGFVVEEKDVLAQTRAGKQVLNVSGKAEAKICIRLPEDADYIATIGKSRKMLVFPIEEIPEMTKGKGVMLQKGGLVDVKGFNIDEGLTYRKGSSEEKVKNVKLWIGKRAQAGRLPPNGFPRGGKFGG